MKATTFASALIAGLVVAQDPTPTSGTNPGPTLISGHYWIRAVAPPNYHSYLQSQPTGVPSDAFLDAATEAGQFSVEGGQVVYNTGAGGSLYLNVEPPTDPSSPERTLRTYFTTEESTYGEFGLQGDTLTWHVDEISRPNEAAWLVCEGQQLFVNTGPYGYETPAGCADQTASDILTESKKTCKGNLTDLGAQIHTYGGSTPDV